MADRLRVAALGLAHDHVWNNLAELTQTPGAELVAVADPEPSLLERAKTEFHCPAYTSYERLLVEHKLDAVYVFADNATGVELAETAAAEKLHVLIEKPMAATLAGADRMLAAARRAGVRLMVNWPFAWWAPLQHAMLLARQRVIGELWEVKYRSAHQGPRELGCSPYFCNWLYDRDLNGAGAFMDYCCYGAALARALLGMPSRVVGVAGRLVKEDITVDDNGLIVMSYPRAMAISEGSWTQIGHLTAYISTFYGTRGTLLIEPGPLGRILLASPDKPDGVPIDVPPLPPEDRTASAHFVHCLRTGQEFTLLCQDRVGRDAQEILEAGLASSQSGSEVSLPLRAF
jgi:predicted dehydrogenase